VLVIVIAIVFFFYSRNALVTESVGSSAVTFGLPLALAAMVGIMCERTGVINIGIEGTMLVSAFAGFMVAAISGNDLYGVLAAIAVGAITGLLLSLMAVSWGMNQIIAGTIINIVATGLTSFFYQEGHSIPNTLPELDIPGLSRIPFFGPVLFMHGPITYFGLLFIVFLWVALFHSAWGLRSRAVGENPASADAAGISVVRMRYLNVTLAGAVGGLTGAYLSLELVGSFERGFTAGKGFTALALMIFGRWNPLGALAAAMFFGVAQAEANQLMIDEVVKIPPQFINMLPYVLTLVVLAISAGKVRAPAAEGHPYERGQM
jgi:ABC-type uncharacterized transport system permease subunit